MESMHETPFESPSSVNTHHGDVEMNTAGIYEPVGPSTSQQHHEEKRVEVNTVGIYEPVGPSTSQQHHEEKRVEMNTAGIYEPVGPSTSQQHREKKIENVAPTYNKEKESRGTSVRSAVQIALLATLLILNFVISVVGVIFITQHINDHQSKPVLENLEKNLTSMINNLEVVSDYVDVLAAQNLNLSKEVEFLQKRTAELDFLLRPDCSAVSRESNRGSGVFDTFYNGKHYEVYCDTTTDGGEWTVFQRRMDGSVDFYRTWEEYANGFGNKSDEFWQGLEAVHQLTQDGAYELRVDLTDWEGSTAYAKYGTFSINGRSDNYRLTVGEYSGTAGDALAMSNNSQFTAKNKDLDSSSGGNCATVFKAAWWFASCSASSLNGIYNDTSGNGHGVFWYHWKRRLYSLKGSEMKFRKK